MDELAPLLKQLPEPMAPATMTATVMARIAREADRQAAAAATAEPRRERPAWLWSVVGVVLVIGIRLYGLIDLQSLPDITSARIGLGNLPTMPGAGPVSMALGLGVLLYLGGLFAPLRRGRT